MKKKLQEAVDNKKNKNRFRVAPVEERTLDGIVFASKKEMNRYAELRLMAKAKLISDLELQPQFVVSINGHHFCTYTADFKYIRDGQCVIEELKSTGTAKDAAYRLRKKAAELFYGIKVEVILK
jgi:Protein of unknown function (DUF1064)